GSRYFSNAVARGPGDSETQWIPAARIEQEARRIEVLNRIPTDVVIEIRVTTVEENRIAGSPPANLGVVVAGAEADESAAVPPAGQHAGRIAGSGIVKASREPERLPPRVRVDDHVPECVVVQRLDHVAGLNVHDAAD